MKILFVDTSVSGHHFSYMRALSQIEGIQCHYMLPTECNIAGTIHIRPLKAAGSNIFIYVRWLLEIRKVARMEKITTIHILNGDLLCHYYGFFLGMLKKEFKVVITFHQDRNYILHKFIYKRIFNHLHVGIVHNELLEQRIRKDGINNVCFINYPSLFQDYFHDIKSSNIKDKWGIPKGKKVILALGETRYEKGIDLLIKALNLIKEEFFLLVVGQEKDFDEAYIKKAANFTNYKLHMNLSDEEMIEIYRMADMVVLPYRKGYDGTSGPLCEGAAYEKLIIGPNHGNLGHIIKNNHLGFVYESENVQSLADTLEMALDMDFAYDEKALYFSERLSIHEFCGNYKNLFDIIGA